MLVQDEFKTSWYAQQLLQEVARLLDVRFSTPTSALFQRLGKTKYYSCLFKRFHWILFQLPD